MKKYIKHMMAAIACLGIVSFTVPVLAASTQNVYDYAGLLSESEAAELEQNITSFESESEWSLAVLSTNDAEGKSAMEYADDFYDTTMPGESGAVFLIDMDNREMYISTGGEAIRYLTDERIDIILDDAYDAAQDGDYAACYEAMLTGVSAYYEKGIPSGQYNYDTETGEKSYYRSLTMVEVFIALAIAAAVGFAVFFGIVGKYRLKFGTYQYDFHSYGKTDITRKKDQFVNQVVTHRRIQQEPPPGEKHGGQSSTHTSRGGGTHGGGGRSF